MSNFSFINPAPLVKKSCFSKSKNNFSQLANREQFFIMICLCAVNLCVCAVSESRVRAHTRTAWREHCKQHIPKFTTSTSRKSPPRRCKANSSPRQFHEFAIGQHLLDNPKCASHYNDDKFSILARGRSFFHLFASEATFLLNLSNLFPVNKKNSFVL